MKTYVSQYVIYTTQSLLRITFFDVRYFVHIITIYNQIATKGKSMFGPHKCVMQLLI